MGVVYTKTGDKGKTGLIGGKRVEKHNLRLEAYGTIDELNSYIGLIRSFDIDTTIRKILEEIQAKLFTVGAHLAVDEDHEELKEKFTCSENEINILEKEIDRINSKLPEMNSFILPGGNQIVSYTHIARTVCRRAERRISALMEIVEISPNILKYVNRLSDYLFVVARKFAIDTKAEEVEWKA
ncbi:MAG: cob(I)yrinic acid a,c-diamide adenosyltransferase [Marinifilaceae bacterium]|jgi:cob(I)alamin adenosyltransferase|nr:cob(I)yrinic acid a,c-diamide adenosyltransferase [Marinifilaceae bacterium]